MPPSVVRLVQLGVAEAFAAHCGSFTDTDTVCSIPAIVLTAKANTTCGAFALHTTYKRWKGRAFCLRRCNICYILLIRAPSSVIGRQRGSVGRATHS